MKSPGVSVVICTYNSMETIGKSLDCMIRQETDGKFSYEINVIDDDSTDDTRNIVEKIAAKSTVPVKYFRSSGKGVAQARNVGIAHSHGEWIAFFDQDQLAEPNWLKELFDVASKTGADVVDGPRDLALSHEQLSRLSPICRRILGERIAGSEIHRCMGRTCSCTGNVLINRKVFNVVGGFDEAIITGGEDWDFFRRVRAASFVIWYAPRAMVHHLIPPSRLSEQSFKLNSLRCGSNFAQRDYREWGLSKTLLAWIARMGQALLVNMPLLFWAYLMRCDAEILGRKCLLLRTVGYSRKCLFLSAPSIFPQRRFFARIEFRKMRASLVES